MIDKKHSDRKSPNDFHALLGRYDLNNNNEPNFVRNQISDIFLHDRWDTNSIKYDYDIAILQMNSPVTFNDYIQPICLPSNDFNVFGLNGTVAGYGLSENNQPHENRPKHVEIKSVVHEDCVFDHPGLARIGSIRTFCAGERGKSPCKGKVLNTF